MSLTFEYNTQLRTSELGTGGINNRTVSFRTIYGLAENPDHEILFNGHLSDMVSDYSLPLSPLNSDNPALVFTVWANKEIGIKFGSESNVAMSGLRYLTVFADVSAAYITTASATQVLALAYGGSNCTITFQNPSR